MPAKRLHIGVRSILGDKHITYAGIVNDEVFSIAHEYVCGMNGERAAHNLFFPIPTKDINIDNSIFEVRKITPEYIILKPLEENL